jgi:2,4-diketo-3-deoxy-L-fuconate hydrolase
MKLCRFGNQGHEKPGLFDASGILRDLSPIIADLGPSQISPASLQQLARLDPAVLQQVDGQPRLGPPIAGTRQFLAIGLNYSDHLPSEGNRFESMR